jgi:hypothetical protein
MGQHNALKVYTGTDGQRHYRCACGWAPDPQPTQQALDDEIFKHHKEVERARASLGRRGHTDIKVDRDYYLERANDPNETKANRHLWQQLADELSKRIGGEKGAEDEPLF